MAGPGYRPEIDGMRAIAVLSVILSHAGLPAVPGGYLGVDVFFVISGFLIGGILLDEMAAGRVSLARFYERRIRRIFPALFVMLAIVTPIAAVVMTPYGLAAYGKSLAATALSISNFSFWTEAGYFSDASELKPLLHTWSLGIEEQFYLFLPLAMLLLARSRIVFAVALAVAIALSFHTAMRLDPDSAFFLPHARAWELLAGVAAALAMRHLAVPASDMLASLGLVLIIAAIVMLEGGQDGRLPAPLPAVAGAVLLLLFARDGTRMAWLLSLPPVALIGLISYSAYLWHQPIFALTRIALDGEVGPVLTAILIAASLGAGWVSWRFVEQPFRRRRSDTTVPVSKAYRAGGGAVVVSVTLGLVCWLSLGFLSARSTPMQRAYLDTARPAPTRTACHASEYGNLSTREACLYGAAPAGWAVYGDSHGVEIAYALGQRIAAVGGGLKHFTHSACSPAYGRPSEIRCADWSAEAVALIAADEAIHTVVVAHRLTHLTPDIALYTPPFRAAVQALIDAGKRVVVVRESPPLSGWLPDLVFRAGDAPAIRGRDRAEWAAMASVWDDLLPTLPPAVIIIDPTPLLCPGATCQGGRDGVAFYFDDNHLSVEGADRVAGLILAETGVVAGAP